MRFLAQENAPRQDIFPGNVATIRLPGNCNSHKYKEDDIPDDIQEEQLKLYQDNFEAVKSAVALNEKLLLKLDALAIELSSATHASAQRTPGQWKAPARWTSGCGPRQPYKSARRPGPDRYLPDFPHGS